MERLDDRPGFDAPFGLGGAPPAVEQVAAHAQVREQETVLKDHADPPLLRRQVDAAGAVKQHGVVQADRAAIRPEQPGQQVHQGRLAAARRAEQADAVAGQVEVGGELELPQLFLHRDREPHHFRSSDLEAAPLANSTTKDSRIDTRQSDRAIRSPPGVLVYS